MTSRAISADLPKSHATPPSNAWPNDELKKSREELEKRVKERTAQLSAINQNLEKEITERSRLEQEILLISEREKRRIGEDLHDSLCQELAATAFLLESHAQKIKKTNPAEAKTLSESAQSVNRNVGLARDLAQGLHPVELSASGLTNALRDLAYRTSQGSRSPTAVSIARSPCVFSTTRSRLTFFASRRKP